MPKIEIDRPMSVPAVPAQAAASSILHEIADGRREWSDFALYLQLGALGFPDVGYVAIPVNIEFRSEQAQPQHRIDFCLRAKRSPQSFPVLNGALGVSPTGPSSSSMWMGGEYELPGGAVGAAFNRIVGERAANITLENMAAELAHAIEARVERKERSEARYRLVFNAGD